jgi:hypothetical protein
MQSKVVEVYFLVTENKLAIGTTDYEFKSG